MTTDDADRVLLAERILAEQEERRRLAELLHDGPVQHLSAIAQMLDAGLASLRDGETQRADDVFTRGLALARDSARDLRALCDDLEPKVLREVGFAAAVARAGATDLVAIRRGDRSRRRLCGRARRERPDSPLPDPPRGNGSGRQAGSANSDRDLGAPDAGRWRRAGRHRRRPARASKRGARGARGASRHAQRTVQLRSPLPARLDSPHRGASFGRPSLIVRAKDP